MPRGKAKPFKCGTCDKAFPLARQLGAHRRFAHNIMGTSYSAKRNREIRGTNGKSEPANSEETNTFNFGYACASVQALITTLAERDGLSAELLAARVAKFLSSAPLRK
jgi:hypothetical protein